MRRPSRASTSIAGMVLVSLTSAWSAACTTASPPITPGVECGSRRCMDLTPVCCLEFSPGSFSSSCADPRVECLGSRYECDEGADCGGSRRCCLRTRVTASGVTSSTTCATRCEPDEAEVCNVTSAACSTGAPCCPTGSTFAVCASGPSAVCPGSDAGPDTGAGPEASAGDAVGD